MANLSTEDQRRDFIAEEIKRKIVGPGFAQDVYLCNKDASDEILTERPQVVYTSGILFPKQASDDGENSQQAQVPTPNAEDLFGDPYQDDNEDIADTSNNKESEEVGEDAENLPLNANSNDLEEGLSDERAGFNPDKIGLITCLKANTLSIGIDISYGRYRLLREDEWKNNVRVPLDRRCPINILNNTLDYYNTSAKDLLNKLGVNSAHDLFEIDTVNKTVSPTRELSYQIIGPNNEVRKKYVYASSFPALPRNKAAAIVCKVLKGDRCELDDFDWAELQKQILFFDTIKEVQDLLSAYNFGPLISHISYDASSNSVSLINGPFRHGDTNIGEYLFTHDPVKDYILDKLLEYRYFKREQVSGHIDLDLSKNFGKEDLGDGAFLHWKAFYYAKNRQVRYLRVLLQNCTVVAPRSGDIPHIFQAEIRLESNNIVSYSEPQTSFIDGEFNLNEKLYAEESVYGKGVNCAVTWEDSRENYPTWIKTTYTPSVKVRSFSTSMNDKRIKDICDVHNLSIWGKTDNEIISGLSLFADSFKNWMLTQMASAGTDCELNKVIDRQKEFLERYKDNINYLKNNPRAMQCFRLANTAMYIQMLLGRDPKFREKGKDKSKYTSGDLFYTDCWNYFKTHSSPIIPAYYPFQLAFLVMNVKSTFESSDSYRTDKVDLIWFPTGGGKTEAYLALTALTIAERRTSSHPNTNGVSVIMRYTLRLLTAQQFERASYLICAMEYMRNHFLSNTNEEYFLGSDPITLGMWIGQAAAPNKIIELGQGKFGTFFREKTMESNPFPIVYCPWCGCNLVGEDKSIGYDKGSAGRRKNDICLNHDCHFHSGLPIYYIDEQLYNNPPTLLFATVDKFAQLNTKSAGKLFGTGTDCRKPDLIIQDELHLISGPLGSLVGLFESLVEELTTERDNAGNVIRMPKIIASTATTRNTRHLIRQLYKRDVVTFPASGIKYSDNFFSHILSERESKRKYVGMSPTGHSASELEIRTIAAELVAKEKIILEWLKSNGCSFTISSILTNLCNNSRLVPELDIYWSQVLYYINLKSLGRTHSRINQEIKATVENMRRYTETYPELNFILDGFYARNTEFTSRQNSSQIKKLLIKADEPTIIEQPQPGVLRIESQMDIVQATNMISVGIDIDRWNVMMMIGQPLTTAEYIQASSRSGRHHQGLVINLYNPLRSRELSFYENYTSYHQVFYKFVEPLSATTFTEMTIDKLLLNLYVGYMVLVNDKRYIKDVTTTEKDKFCSWMASRASATCAQSSLISSLTVSINDLYLKLSSIDTPSHSYSFNDIITKVDLLPKVGLAHLMKSLRDVEQNTYLNYE